MRIGRPIEVAVARAAAMCASAMRVHPRRDAPCPMRRHAGAARAAAARPCEPTSAPAPPRPLAPPSLAFAITPQCQVLLSRPPAEFKTVKTNAQVPGSLWRWGQVRSHTGAPLFEIDEATQGPSTTPLVSNNPDFTSLHEASPRQRGEARAHAAHTGCSGGRRAVRGVAGRPSPAFPLLPTLCQRRCAAPAARRSCSPSPSLKAPAPLPCEHTLAASTTTCAERAAPHSGRTATGSSLRPEGARLISHCTPMPPSAAGGWLSWSRAATAA